MIYPVFDEDALKAEIERVWGKYGAHMEVFLSLVKQRDDLKTQVLIELLNQQEG